MKTFIYLFILFLLSINLYIIAPKNKMKFSLKEIPYRYNLGECFKDDQAEIFKRGI